MASPRPVIVSELLAENALLSGLVRSADTLPALVDPDRGPSLGTGAPRFDRLLSGGLSAGSFAEFAGPLSSGVTACAHALTAHATRDAFAAWVDLSDAFDPPSADACGVDLGKLLWVRAPTPEVALRASERLLLSRAFSLVVLDFFSAKSAPVGSPPRRSRSARSIPPASAWLRLKRSAVQTRCALLLLSPEALAGAVPALTLLAHPVEPCFAGNPRSHAERSGSESWFEGAIARFDLARDRRRPREQNASIPLAAHPEVPPSAYRVPSGARSPRRCGAARVS